MPVSEEPSPVGGVSDGCVRWRLPQYKNRPKTKKPNSNKSRRAFLFFFILPLLSLLTESILMLSLNITDRIKKIILIHKLVLFWNYRWSIEFAYIRISMQRMLMPLAPVLILRVNDTIMLTIIREKIVRIYKVVRIIKKGISLKGWRLSVKNPSRELSFKSVRTGRCSKSDCFCVTEGWFRAYLLYMIGLSVWYW